MVSAKEEREFEKAHIASQKAHYISCDVTQKVKVDPGYAEKISQIEHALGAPRGWVLDVGGNTCGESEFLTTEGYSIIAVDINEVALGISKERCMRFNRKPPHYLACDAHFLALADRCVRFVILNEALHHMEDPFRALNEVYRVLTPGGRVFLYEPYALNPYRRLSEIRDRFKGTIERSFTVRQLKKLLEKAGLKPVSFQRHTCPPSQWKMEVLSDLRRLLREVYFAAYRVFPGVLGNIVAVAEKAAASSAATQAGSFESMLRCPVTGAQLVRLTNREGLLSLDEEFRGLYPTYMGIPMLIKDEVRRLEKHEWELLAGSVKAENREAL